MQEKARGHGWLFEPPGNGKYLSSRVATLYSVSVRSRTGSEALLANQAMLIGGINFWFCVASELINQSAQINW